MTTESQDTDARVSAAYRDLASERTPPELDRQVLSMVARNKPSRYGMARAWTRPVAWAAVIGLSLAFVLELTQEPESAAPPASGSDAGRFEAIEERVLKVETPARAKSDTRLRQESEKRSDAPAISGVSSPPAAAEPAPAQSADSASADFDAHDMSLLREAEEQARAQTGSESPAAGVAQVSTFAEKKEQAAQCDADARVSAATWYACIEELRSAGLAETAVLELEFLHAEFPEFQVPDPDR